MAKEIKNLNIRTISCEEAKQSIAKYEFVIAHMISELQYGRTEEAQINWNELLELRAFSDREELRVYHGNSGLTAQICTETAEKPDNTIVLTYNMKNGKKLKVKEYMEQDEDGQAVVGYTRPLAMV